MSSTSTPSPASRQRSSTTRSRGSASRSSCRRSTATRSSTRAPSQRGTVSSASAATPATASRPSRTPMRPRPRACGPTTSSPWPSRRIARPRPLSRSVRTFGRRLGASSASRRKGKARRPGRRLRFMTLCVLEPLAPKNPRAAWVEVTRLSGGDALSAVLPHGLRLLPLTAERERRILSAYLQLVAAVPVYRVEYERRFEALPLLVRELERRLPS